MAIQTARPGARPAWAGGAVMAMAVTAAMAQEPAPPTGPAAPAPPARMGLLRRMASRPKGLLHRYFVGDPRLFAEPPLGASVYGTFGVMKAKADVHDFILYDSDFLAGTDALSPEGSARVGRMAARLPGWLGPIIVEATPGRPGLAEMRRQAVTRGLRGAGLPVVAERVVVGASPYYGDLGADAANNYDNMIYRNARAARVYSVTPTSTTPFGAGAR